MKKILTLLSFLAIVFAANAQNGDISGKVRDENGEGVPFANVVLVDGKGVPTGRGTSTDFDGNYSINPLTPGKYNLQVSYVGYAAQIIQGVVVNSEKSTFIDVKLKPSSQELKAVEIISYKVPLIDPGNTSATNVVGAAEIANMSTKNIGDIAATTAGVFQNDQGGSINIRGGREDGTQYYVDGVKVIGTPTIPASSIEQLQVITGGVPAKYGDLSGGIVNITSKGPSSQLNGSVEVETTQGLDAYGYNLVSASLEGPLWKQKSTKKTILGFFTAFEYEHQNDPSPSAIGLWQVRPSLLDSLRANPLQKTAGSQGFSLAANNVSMADMYKQLVKPNTPETDFRGNARIDIRPVDNITLSFGASANIVESKQFVYGYSLFNSDNNPSDDSRDYRVYGRFTQNIQSKQSEEDAKDGKKKKSSAFQNAYYTVQVDYEKYTLHQQGAGGTNPFDYGYIGKFNTKTAPIFAYDTFAIGNKVYQGWKQTGVADTAVAFTGSKINPNSTAYTQEYYQLLGALQNPDGSMEVYNSNNANYTANVIDIAANQGLINGSRSNYVNNIWYNTGRAYGAYGNYQTSSDPSLPGGGNSDQYHVRLEGAFDILKPGAASRNKHSFEFGIEYEQRIERNYEMFPLLGNGLWSLARSLVNNQLSTFDVNNPIFRINGTNYAYNDPNRPNFYLTDTILFNPLYNASQQTYFDQQLRQALGLAKNSLTMLNVDNLDPSFLNIKMFSPDELIGQSGAGSQYVTYRGYDVYGNVLTSQPSFNDFFTQKDANGNYTRLIPAYRPIYTDAYISDRFFFKDLAFNVGVRFDRFDANQEELIDPYSLYPIKTAGEVTNLDGNAVVRPADIGSNYAVYVDNSSSPTAITGYRNGQVWYDKYGNQLASGAAVAAASSTGTIQPYLKNPNENIQIGSSFDPNQSFQQYKPDLIVMPRLQFSFSLTDKALFFAHYDILSQRPNSAQVAVDPTQYYFFVNNIGGVLNNPALQPSRTVDYELGFKQRVSNTAAFTVSAFYREFRDQVEITKITNAYPNDYITYGNIDFGTTKGVTLDFDMRRTGNFSLKANYTLQFADGTGSDPTTQLTLINANSPNIRSISPLNYDSRHLINLNLTYSYGVGKDYNGPTIKNVQILSDAGISLQLSTRSGTPYTAQENVTPQALQSSGARAVGEGSINGSRLPWYFRVNMRVWKNFSFTVGKKKENKDSRRDLGLQIYLQIQNLLNTQNVLTVYRYTGTASSDGYLNDPGSLSAIESALNPKAFKDQYAVYINNPSNYSLPRRIYLGGIFNF